MTWKGGFIACIVVAVIATIALSVIISKGKKVLRNIAYAFEIGEPSVLEKSDVVGHLDESPLQTYSASYASYLLDQLGRYLHWHKNAKCKAFPLRPNINLKDQIYTQDGVLSCLILENVEVGASIVLFKGTTTGYERGVDLNFYQKKRRQYITTKQMMSSGLSMPTWLTQRLKSSSGDARAHAGFSSFYDGMRARIFKSLSKMKNKTVYLCGHSLGAALATLCTLDLTAAGYDPARVWTVTAGCPRVGNQAFARLFFENKINLYNLRNVADVVPSTPFARMPMLWEKKLETYVHSGQGLCFYHLGKNLYFCHCLRSYQLHAESESLVVSPPEISHPQETEELRKYK